MSLSYGINVHHRTTGSYASVPLATQMTLAKAMGFRFVRVDIDDGSATTFAWLDAMVTAAGVAGLQVLPVFSAPNSSYISSEQIAYNWCKGEATKLAQHYQSKTLAGWMCSNELNLYPGCQAPGTTGQNAADFNTATYKIARGAIRGMIDGFRSVSTGRKTCGVGTTGVNWGYLDKLWADGIRWDTTLWHIYPNVGTTMADLNSGAATAFTRLTAYGKPVAVTEFNQQAGHFSTTSAQTLIDIMTVFEAKEVYYRSSRTPFTSACVYELLDETALGGGEATYGLCDASGTMNTLGLAVKARLTS